MSSDVTTSSRVGFNIPPSLTIPNPSSWTPDEFISPGGSSSLNPASLPFYGGGGGGGRREAADLIDELQLQEQLSFLNESSSSPNFGPKSSDLYSDDAESGFGWRPCLYFARGFCKNGSSCRFVHGGDTSSSPHSPKFMNFLLQQQLIDSPRSRLDRNDLVNPASRQIYLTFPADSSFKEEDVSNYFSIYGPVQDVRIPYQHKRMFGFVTFVFPETVKMILAKGNPHFVCDARVLVKPYKEKGKVPDKNMKQQQVGRRDFYPSSTLTGLNSRDPYDLQLGARMLLRRKLEEQADLQQALELQSRRLMGLKLLEMKHHHNRALSAGSPIPSPTHSYSFFNQSAPFSPLHSSTGVLQERQAPIALSSMESTTNPDNGRGREVCDLQDSLVELNLPDSPFASPTKASVDYFSPFSYRFNEVEKGFNCQIPRLSSGHTGIGMCASTSGSTCPIGIELPFLRS